MHTTFVRVCGTSVSTNFVICESYDNKMGNCSDEKINRIVFSTYYALFLILQLFNILLINVYCVQ